MQTTQMNPCIFACDDIIIKNSLPGKILGLIIDNNLGFSDHISNMWKTANQKLSALFRFIQSKLAKLRYKEVIIT